MKIGSLFTGTGALDMAAQALLGGEVIWHSDIKPAAVTFLEHRFPTTPNIGDIIKLFPAVGPLPREAYDLAVDLLTFGWPCQPHSSAGKRLGEDDPRALWPNVARAVAELRPRILLGENVARVATNGELRRAVASLAALGYVGAWRCVTAGSVGAPHRRDRLFLVGLRADVAADAHEAGWQGPGAEQDGRPTGQRPHAGTGRPGSAGGDREPRLTLLPTPAVADARNTRNATAGRSEGQEHHHSGWTLSDVAHADRWGRYTQAIARWEPIMGRPAPEPTRGLTRNGNPLLNPAFPEWMMGLPAGWVTDVDMPRNQQLSMIGDGVVPLQATVAYSQLLAELTRPCGCAA